jgi:glycosyltransferase involved in cell wall biosynthesis
MVHAGLTENMHILFDHQIFCLQQYGGISRYFHELARNLADMPEQKVEIFAPLHRNEYLSVRNGVSHHGVKLSKLSNVTRAAAWGVDTVLAYPLLRSRHGVDIFHETYYSAVDCCPRSAKRIVTVFDMIHEKFVQASPMHERTRQAKAHAVKRADHVICISENTRRDLVELLDVPEKKISVVYLGYSLTGRDQGKISTGNQPYILYVGERGGYKNFENLLRVYAKSAVLRDGYALACFGGGPFSLRERRLMETQGLSTDRVIHYSGGDDVLSALYRAAAAFVYPSLYEGFGIPPLEAMSLGCPVVCSNSSSLPEAVGDAAELFDPADETEIGVAIERVVSFPQRSRLLVERGYQRIKRFSWERCAQETMQVYERQL